MIKVNLAKDMAITAPSETAVAMEMDSDKELQKEILIKVVSMLSLVVVLFIYEKFSLSAKKDELKRLQRQVNSVQAEVAKFGKVSEVVAKVTKEKRAIEEQINIIRGLSKTRLTQVKVLDAIQSLMPDRTWLRGVSLKGTEVKLEGFSLTSDGIPLLIRALDESVFFDEIDVETAAQEQTADGTFNKFEISCQLGGQL